MKNRTIWIIVAVVGVIGLLFMAAGSTAVLGYTALKGLSRVSFKPDFSVALAQDSQNQIPAQTPDRNKGILVAGVTAGSPAERAGIVRGDIIMQANGQPVELNANLIQTLQNLNAGDKIDLQILHGDELKNITLELQQGESGLSLGISPCGLEIPGGGFTHQFRSSNGAQVEEVVQGGPAEKAGVKVGDVITAIDGKAIDANNHLPDVLSTYKPGDQITLTVQRSGTENQDIKVTLGQNPDDASKTYLGIRYSEGQGSNTPQNGNGQGQIPFGELPKDLPFLHPQFTLPEGMQSAVVIAEVTQGSPAEAAGLKAGDVITAIDGKTVETADALVSAVQAKKPGDTVELTVIHSGETQGTSVQVTLGENPDKAGSGYMGVKIGVIHQQQSGDQQSQQNNDGQNLPSWLQQLLPKNFQLPKDFQLPIPPQNGTPSGGNSQSG